MRNKAGQNKGKAESCDLKVHPEVLVEFPEGHFQWTIRALIVIEVLQSIKVDLHEGIHND